MRHRLWILLAVATTTLAQAPPVRPVELPVKVEVVLTRDEQGVKVNAPYTLSAISSGVSSTLRIGAEVPITAVGPDGQNRTTTQQVGTEIHAMVRATDDGRFSVALTITLQTLSVGGQLVKFASTNTVTPRDGETTRYTATDKDNGATYDFAVTLTIVK
jgi:urease gamma subunit